MDKHKTETIGSLLPQAVPTGHQPLPQQWRHLEPQANKLRASHTDLAEYKKAVNPDLQVKYGMQPARAFGNGAPQLVLLDAAYGENAGVMWLMPQLFAVGEFAGVREKMDEVQTLELARVIRAKYGFLTVTELMYFFFNLKAGKYGKFYGAVDPMVITEALGEFIDEWQWRHAQIEQDERRARREKEERETVALKPHEIEALRKRLQKEGKI